MTTGPRKLIEVALPLDEINAACRADKERKTGTLRNLHKWFAPMPLPAWRALLFAALVDDPGDEDKRIYLLDLIKRLVANGADLPDQDTLDEAKSALAKQFPDGFPTVMDPFCGGGSTLVEAQRLGLPSYGSDLNPVPALISRALTETLPKVRGRSQIIPVRTIEKRSTSTSDQQADLLPGLETAKPESASGYDGLVSDLRYYGNVVLEELTAAVGTNFPRQDQEQPIAWIWSRTAICPNPACGIETVLATTWWLSKKKNDLAWIEPGIEGGRVSLKVISGQHQGEAPLSAKIGDGVFACIACSATLSGDYLRGQGRNGLMGLRMIAVVVDVPRSGRPQRVYRAPTDGEIAAADIPDAPDEAAIPINPKGQSIRVPLYGLTTWASLYTPRQMLVLTSLAAAIRNVHKRVIVDGGDADYADAITTLLGLALGKMAQSNSTQTRWYLRPTSNSKAVQAFDRNDLPMMWDFAETYYASESVGSWKTVIDSVIRSLAYAPNGEGLVRQQDARTAHRPGALIATDPPYFDAIGYADLSDYFYVWHRLALRDVHPDLYVSLAAPKTGELTAIAGHHGGNKDAAKRYFIQGFTEVFTNLQRSMAPDLPLIVVYASKEQKGAGDEQTRWASILTAMIQAKLEITGTWPIHAARSARMIGIGTNAVAAYIAMTARPRPATAETCSLGEFTRALRRELGSAVREFQAASILPVDMAQAVMGPGMAIYSRYSSVLDQRGEPLSVDVALRIINSVFGEVQDEQEGELDADSQFAVTWWHKHGWGEATFGEADALARPKGLGVDDVVRAQVVTSKAGKVAALGREGLDRSWDPLTDVRPTAWEAAHHLVDRLIDGGGEAEAAVLLDKLTQRGLADSARALTYRLAALAADTKRTKDEERYNALIDAWTRLVALSHGNGGLF
ncbi:DUF1156 domain-containing protein [Micromonospora sp. MA102]|uniref:DUF1156 domain-containing protein n=1 Tax=Micromonospora sp. MA102 TaxID=2952755 RepID=UPI0021C7B0DF|nr:DUF1156 domain-containing protein [Micromonospora sp. MA102]